MPAFSIPFLPVSYNRTRGLEMRERDHYFRSFIEENEG
jgi:hypothetical protein